MKLILWTGHRSPFNDPAILKRLATGAIRPDDLTELRKREQARICAVPGRSEFSVGPAHGFSRTYVWGPHVFEVWVEDADVELLFTHPRDRAMFRDITDEPGSPGAPLLIGDGVALTDGPEPVIVHARS